MTDATIAELRELLAKATPGDWAWDAGVIPPDGPGRYADIYVTGEDLEPIILAEFNDSLPEGRDNARLITAALNALPALLDRADVGERLARLAKEYRPTMDRDVLHSWAVDIVDALTPANKEPSHE
ncbi:hypothetical protein HHL08_14215 [Sphingobium sp. AR-3-1]|uniref:Uncharacterized protein n=1 Tax=Sphingobium psychrophilum TaxID=2728834 RepID=A0A7X9WWQ7_9SPHN|nr:hypothetical protein [Sphingobium psychrophilum]NML11286.1 hypothetical protein [Sphingobium psychrophilum]